MVHTLECKPFIKLLVILSLGIFIYSKFQQSSMENIIRLVGSYGLAGSIIWIGYLFWDKNVVVSIILLIIGICLAISIIVSEIYFKKRRHEAPWQFEEYKGD